MGVANPLPCAAPSHPVPGLRDHMEDAYQMIKDLKIGGKDTSAVYLAL